MCVCMCVCVCSSLLSTLLLFFLKHPSPILAMAATNDPLPPSLLEERQSQLDDTKMSLDRIKKQLTTSGRFLLQGPLLKRSETLRKWNQRWFSLDPTTGKMEYRIQRGNLAPKGLIHFDGNSTITVSPINFQGLKKYDGCCIYIETLQKEEYFLCAETPGAARAWVATLRAAQLVLKAHKEAVDSLSGNGSSKLGTVAAVVAAANATARESAKEIEAAVQMSMKAALNSKSSQNSDGFMDDLSIMKETLRVKDEELHQLARELRAKDSTIKDMADRLSETAEAAEAAASAAHIMDKERKAARAEIARLHKELDDKLRVAALQLRAVHEKLVTFEKDRDEALQEAHTWRVELGKAREREVLMEAAMLRAEENARLAAADAELKVKAALEKEATANVAKEEAQKEVQYLLAQLNGALIPKEIVHSHTRDVENVWHQPTIDVHADEQVNISHSSESSFVPVDAITAASVRSQEMGFFNADQVVLENGEGHDVAQILGSNGTGQLLGSTYESEQKTETEKHVLLNNDNRVYGINEGNLISEIPSFDGSLTRQTLHCDVIRHDENPEEYPEVSSNWKQ